MGHTTQKMARWRWPLGVHLERARQPLGEQRGVHQLGLVGRHDLVLVALRRRQSSGARIGGWGEGTYLLLLRKAKEEVEGRAEEEKHSKGTCGGQGEKHLQQEDRARELVDGVDGRARVVQRLVLGPPPHEAVEVARLKLVPARREYSSVVSGPRKRQPCVRVACPWPE